ncbi:hypothetical protein [Morganella phage Mecenats66]|nr:hypothetical protein [Morganella phage Mecenats66]
MTENKKHYREIGDGLMAVIRVVRQYGKGDPSIVIETSLGDKYHPMYGCFTVELTNYHKNTFTENMEAMLNLLHSEILLPLMIQRFINNDMPELQQLSGDSPWSFGSSCRLITITEAKHAR